MENETMETAQEHTPGPWTVENNEETYDTWNIVATETDNGDVVAEVPKTGDEDYDSKVSCANARLIAAAPDLLTACRRAVKHIDAAPEHNDADDEMLVVLRAAIALATQG